MPRKSRRHAYGLTVLELLVVIAIFAAILAAGVPGFAVMISNQRLQTEASNLHHAFHRARREAIKRGIDIGICKSRDGSQCHGSADWHDGWMLFVNVDGDYPADRDRDEPILRVHRPQAQVRIVSNRDSYSSRALRRRSTNGSLTLCDNKRRGNPRRVIVSYSGRPRVESGAAGSACAR